MKIFNKFIKNYSVKISHEILKVKSNNFWKSKKPNLDSMCGFKELNEEDNLHTQILLKNLNINSIHRSLDIGSGIGRITFNSLYSISKEIDIVESNITFINYMREYHNTFKDQKIKNFYNNKIEEFAFVNIYDLIFIQWVLEYVDYPDINLFFQKMKNSMHNDSIVIIKENINIKNDVDIILEDQGAIVRPYRTYEELFMINGFKIIQNEIIDYKSISDLYEIKCWILKKI